MKKLLMYLMVISMIATCVWVANAQEIAELPAGLEAELMERAGNGSCEFNSLKNVQAATGEAFTMVLKENGTVWAWGDNTYGQLGYETTQMSGIPRKVNELTDIVSIHAGATSAFAVNSKGEVFAWGDNRYAQLGDGTTTNRKKPVRIAALADIKKISAGYYHAIAVKHDGTVYFWGNPTMNPDAQGSVFERTPIAVELQHVKDIASGKTHMLFLTQDGEIYAWGKNDRGQLGNGVFADTMTPLQKIELPACIVKVAAGMHYSMAIDDAGDVYVWGDNSYAQLGDGTYDNSCVPIKLESMHPVKDVMTGYNHAIFLKENDGMYVCGDNTYGQLGFGMVKASTSPYKISHQCELRSLSGGLYHTIEIDAEGNLYGWGSSANRQLGNSHNTPNAWLEPTDVYRETYVMENIVSIESGMYHSLALDRNGTVWSWGYNSHGQLGDGTTINRDMPGIVTSDVQRIAAGYYHNVALKNDGTVWAWGSNHFGQAGQEKARNYLPVQVPDLTDVTAIAAGAYHNLALKNDGTVWMWGRKDYRVVTQGMPPNIAKPVRVEGLADIKAIAIGYYSNFAIDKDGFVYAWGVNAAGQLGDGMAQYIETPVKLPVEHIKEIAAGLYHTLMLDETGTVFAFGDNGHYQYGDMRQNPPHDIQSIAAGEYHSLLLTEDGRVLACGDNSYGQLGNGTKKRSVTPIAVEGLENVIDVAAGYGHSMALMKNGRISAWGNDGSGQIGTGQKYSNAYPCLIGGFEHAKQIAIGERISGTNKHLLGQEWYQFFVPQQATYQFSVTEGFEIEVYVNGKPHWAQQQISIPLLRTDEVYFKVLRKSENIEAYTVSVSYSAQKTVQKEKLVVVNGNEYYINLYDNRCLYRDDKKLTAFPVSTICHNGRDVFVAGNGSIHQVVGDTLKHLVDADTDFMAADNTTIYFSDRNEGNRLYYFKIGSNRRTKMNNDAGIFLEMDNTYLYYYDLKNHCRWTKIPKIR